MPESTDLSEAGDEVEEMANEAVRTTGHWQGK